MPRRRRTPWSWARPAPPSSAAWAAPSQVISAARPESPLSSPPPGPLAAGPPLPASARRVGAEWHGGRWTGVAGSLRGPASPGLRPRPRQHRLAPAPAASQGGPHGEPPPLPPDPAAGPSHTRAHGPHSVYNG